MTHAVVKAKKWGNSIGVIIPREVAERLEINPGEELDIDVIKKERIDFFGIAKGKGLKPFVRDHDDHEF